MLKYFRYLSSPNLISLTDVLTGNVFASSDNESTEAEHEFEQLYKWRTLLNGFAEAKKTGKPIFLLIYKSWCPACQQLKAKFAKSIRLIDLSTHFVMVKTENDYGPMEKQEKFQPDGKYVPRILFFTPNGDLISEAYNRRSKIDPEHRYFYSSPAQIIDTMILVLNMYNAGKSLPKNTKITKVPGSSKLTNKSSWSLSQKDSQIIDDNADITIGKPTVLE